MSRPELEFMSSVQQAVQLSLQEQKPLVVYCTEGNDNWLRSWFNRELRQQLVTTCIALKLTKGQPEYGYFEQIFPSVPVPSVCCIKEGKITGVVEATVVKTDGQVHRNTLLACLGHIPRNTNSESSPKQNSTLKEQAAQRAAQLHHEEVLKQRKVEKEERERIRRLVKADREELKAKNREPVAHERRALDSLHDNIKNTDHLTAKTCTLQIRLLNGHAICHQFKSNATLNSVRRWIDENRDDGDAPYVFFRSIPRESFQESDELRSLSSLQLTPRSVLILKAVENDDNNVQIIDVQGPGLLGRMFNSVTGWWNSEKANEPDSDIQQTTKPNEKSPASSKFNSPANSPYIRHQLARNPSELSLPSRPVSPNVFQFVNADDNEASDRDRKTFNGNSVKLEDKKGKEGK
ncbi:UBX domain-containing protein [Lachancea thermotolerans CBS 6340]|uniref:KLTH0H10340p n=1 Tax=Lachancea thermotolerans (strain ATCC 56472 / CBS 6340 / NRRL Y-8284) TaxID=559295 RepID=C5E347_LACTC|nr:KLTH0H10340p [Lachancea thermotolerans CBS 6340]CAR30458.1 KLTH0H10340p [Lachancea thermotolerans CBS 6340]